MGRGGRVKGGMSVQSMGEMGKDFYTSLAIEFMFHLTFGNDAKFQGRSTGLQSQYTGYKWCTT